MTQYYFITAYDFANNESAGSAVATFTVNNGTCGNTMLNPGQQFVANFNITAWS